jgi:hypothetical protein
LIKVLSSTWKIRGDQEGLFKLVTLNCILNRITGVTSGCWWLVIVNAIPTSDICQINQQNIYTTVYYIPEFKGCVGRRNM